MAAIALTPGARAQPNAGPPTPEALLAAFQYVSHRVASEAQSDAASITPDAAIKELTADEDAAPDAPGAGVCITLRLDRSEIARAVSMENAASLSAATGQALQAADAHIPKARDMLQRAARSEQWKLVTISVELAGPLVPLDIATFADADGRVMVGLDGLAVRMDNRTEAVFPAQMLIANDNAATALIGLASRISGNPALAMPGVPGHEAADLARSNHMQFFKFRSAHAAQMSPGGSAVPLTRGGHVVMSREVTLASLREFAAGLSDNILAQRTSVDGRDELFSCYWPLQDRSEPVAGVREKALACLALCEGARLNAQPDAGATKLPSPVAASQELLVPMLSIEGRLPDSEATPANASMLVVAMSELCAWTGRPKGEWFERARQRLAKAVTSAVDDSGEWNDTTRPPERSIIALALAQLATDPVMGEGLQAAPAAIAAKTRAENAVRALFRDTPPAALVTHLPWLARADVLLAEGGDIKSAAALRQVRDLAWSMQVGPTEAALAGNDMEGGLMLANANGDATPTAQSARAFAFFAQSLGDRRLTDEPERPQQAFRLLRSLRFLRQLALDDTWDWCTPDPSRARWGVRVSPTDQRQRTDATAMTLITVSSAVQSFEKK